MSTTTQHALASTFSRGEQEERQGTPAQSPVQQPGAKSPLHAAAAQIAPGAAQSTNALIMIVDDEPTITDVLQMFLEAAGYGNFVTTNDSREVMRLMAQQQPDVLLLDLVMPEVNGFEILTAMREDGPLQYVPVIMLTSAVDAETRLEALELGATDFLGKPVDPSELALRLRNTLRAKGYQDRLAYYDSLTGLPNRKLFVQKLDQALKSAATENRACAVLHFDLDRFQQVNESYGHAMGDVVLKAVAQRLESSILLGDITLQRIPLEDPFVARLGGDEFSVVLPDLDNLNDVVRFADQISAAFAQPFVVGAHEIFIATRTGIALSPNDGTDSGTLFQKATAATAYAKQKGLKHHQYYSADLNKHVRERMHLENQLYKAVEREELELAYQPKLCFNTGRVTDAETLLRWNHPEMGSVSPAKFIPIAEETGLIDDIGTFVLKTACQQLRTWEVDLGADLSLSVNVSAIQFRNPSFLDTLHKALAETGINACNLVIEVTESVLMENAAESARTLDGVRAMGPKISIDDFGTGYSSLNYLKGFAMDELKIDLSFVRDLPDDQDNCAIVTAIIGLAHGLSLYVVAEGVENEAQFEFLQQHGCHECQGFIASRALPAKQYLDFVQVARDKGWMVAAERVK